MIGANGDKVWGSKSKDPNIPPDWVELKTSVTPRSDRDIEFFHAKLLKFWAQSYLIGVSRIMVGFRSREGMLESVKELRTAELPGVRPRNWDADVCVDFAVDFLQCKYFPLPLCSVRSVPPSHMVRTWRRKLIGTVLRKAITSEGLWRIRRQAGSPVVEVFRVTETGHGDILTEEFVTWRTSGIKGDDG